jgi:hypothetical protein
MLLMNEHSLVSLIKDGTQLHLSDHWPKFSASFLLMDSGQYSERIE